ncbi:MAG TPA: hypothetical protein VHZ50_12720 [Puia sp.]|jgi:hypothetical protein|nr:hypothetical protein [Puia sp.]
MGNPYRKLFNLFAFSLLAFAVYINFFRSDSQLPERKIPFGQANISSQQKSLLTSDASKLPLAKVDKKN